ncbi:MAG: cysteine--tRNA ligase [Gemmatimonadetes bacterium]|nr:cysteine--tRNA ligase [Gemmatimonadota bacterium]
MLRLFNTLSRSKEEFKPLADGKVRMYSCGPTVYDYAHIGNFRAFVLADLLKRYLRYSGYSVFHVMNITDVEDKIIDRLRREGIGLKELTSKYEDIFFAELTKLNVDRADLYPRATEHINEMVQLVTQLRERGLAYEREGSVYFSIDKFPQYGELANLDVAGLQVGISVDADEYDKDNARDFVLWKARVEDDGEVYWESPFGQGRPGWHLECSCMSMKYLGQSFDIHTGGVDLIFPHHQNEIAQSEGVSGQPFVRFWIHNEFLNVNDEKMSKSLGNFYRLEDISKGSEDIKAYRYLLVTNHYRRKMNFTFELLAAAKNNLRRFARLQQRLVGVEGERGREDWPEQIATARAEFRLQLDDDLNTPAAMAAIWGLVNKVERALGKDELGHSQARTIGEFLAEINQVLGIFYDLQDGAEKPETLPEELAKLLEERDLARSEKNWTQADLLREKLLEAGVEIKDSPAGTQWTWKQ